jgi:hypothetical protein
MGLSAEVDDFDAAFGELEAVVDAACEPSVGGWGDRVAAALDAILAFGAADPVTVRGLAVDVFGRGPAGAQRYRRMVDRFASRLVAGRAASSPGEGMPPLIEEALVGAVVSIVAEAVRMGREETLPGLAPELTEFVLSPYLGAEQARRIGLARVRPASSERT